MHTVSSRIMGHMAIVLTGLLLLAGCVVQSLTPFYDESSVIKMPQITGRWRLVTDAGKDVRKKQIKPWIIRDGTAEVFDEKGVGAPLKITFFRIKSTTFVDITAGALKEKEVKLNLWWLFHVVPVHTVCKVISQENRLLLIPLDPHWVRQAGTTAARSLPHIQPMKGEDLDVYYPASAVWMKFLKDHRRNDKAFPGNGRYELLRITQHNQ